MWYTVPDGRMIRPKKQKEWYFIMLKIGRRASCVISLVLSVLTLAAIAVSAVFMPRLAGLLYNLKSSAQDLPLFFGSFPFILTVAYLILAVAAVCDTVLLTLLLAIRRGEVFCPSNVARIRAVSWGCIAASVLFAALTPSFYLSGAVAFIAFFVGLCLRVVKNAFEEAVALKEENDFTI